MDLACGREGCFQTLAEGRQGGRMTSALGAESEAERIHNLIQLTRDWGVWDAVSLYLDRCQVDTPMNLVEATWRHVQELRASVGKVVDFGAGDGRFSLYGCYREYVGYEIDRDRCNNANLPTNAVLLNYCAFSDTIENADICIGNPPFVRNQDLPDGWRQHASNVLLKRTDVIVSGLANAWQYFFLLALASLKDDGLCALVIPYEWVSRPSVKALRNYISTQRWNVSVYRLVDNTFNSVLTTSSITIVDKAARDGVWTYFEETGSGDYTQLPSPSGGPDGVITYLRRSEMGKSEPRAIRGLSPGTQKVLTLSEGERARFGLKMGRDVVPCITTLRHLPADVKELNEASFQTYYRDIGRKCWLIRTDTKCSKTLDAYLDSVPPADYHTRTCLERAQWWRFNMPPKPELLVAMSFRGRFPKIVTNTIGARAVGSVYGIYNVTVAQTERLTAYFNDIDIRDRVVAHSNGLRKIEVNQLNTLLIEAFADDFPTT